MTSILRSKNLNQKKTQILRAKFDAEYTLNESIVARSCRDLTQPDEKRGRVYFVYALPNKMWLPQPWRRDATEVTRRHTQAYQERTNR